MGLAEANERIHRAHRIVSSTVSGQEEGQQELRPTENVFNHPAHYCHSEKV